MLCAMLTCSLVRLQPVIVPVEAGGAQGQAGFECAEKAGAEVMEMRSIMSQGSGVGGVSRRFFARVEAALTPAASPE